MRCIKPWRSDKARFAHTNLSQVDQIDFAAGYRRVLGYGGAWAWFALCSIKGIKPCFAFCTMAQGQCVIPEGETGWIA